MKKDNKNIKISLIVAMADNNCIGRNNQMPWHIPGDLKRFKSLTMGHPVIMGRKTFESILGYLNKPLPGRESIIVTRKNHTLYPNEPIHQAATIEQAIEMATEMAAKQGLGEIFIIGGAQIFKQSLALAHKIYLTNVHREIGGDTFFPKIDEADWEEIESISHKENDPPFSFVDLERRQPNLL
jgi:dihydrofolate reductase